MSLVTFIIPTRNRRHLLPRAVESVKQCGINAEIIIVDDASEDDTPAFCSSLQGVQYIRLDKNLGTAAARNTGIEHCQTPFIAFLDDDDWRLPGTLQEQLDLLQQHEQCGLVYGKVFYANQQYELTGESNLDQPMPEGDVVLTLLRQNFITLSSVVIKKECFDTLGLFDTSSSMLGLEDWDMWLRLSSAYTIAGLNKAVAVYRKPEKNSGQWYSDMGRQYALAGRAYKKKWFKLPGVAARLGQNGKIIKKEILNRTSDIILYSAGYNSRHTMEKLKRIAVAIQCRPSNFVSIKFYKTVVKTLFGKQ